MGTADTMPRLELQPSDTLFIAQADVMNCFYKVLLPEWLQPYFGLDPVSLREASDLGFALPCPQEGRTVDPQLFPCMTVLPMGWSWAFWVIQHLHETICERQGFVSSRRLVAAWPAPQLSTGAVALPYCDNLTILGTDAAEVQAGIDLMCKGFQDKGFALHEISPAQVQAGMLGDVSDGARGTVRGRPEKAWLLKAAFEFVALGGWFSGRQLEVMLGHFIPHALFARGALAVPRVVFFYPGTLLATCPDLAFSSF